MQTSRMPVLFLSHGPGPAWHLKDAERSFGKYTKACNTDSKSANFLRNLYDTLLAKYAPIKAILCVSAHWDEPTFSVQTGADPKLMYDYGNFPEEAYQLEWPAPGAPDIALRTKDLLEQAGIKVNTDSDRSFDHGVFVPLLLVFPKGEIPVFQLSLKNDWNIAEHLSLGKALSPLRDEGVLIITSGHTTHRSSRGNPKPGTWATDFRDWVHDVMTNPTYTPQERKDKFMDTKSQSSFEEAHPTMDHFLPMPIATAASGYTAGRIIYDEFIFETLLISHVLFEN